MRASDGNGLVSAPRGKRSAYRCDHLAMPVMASAVPGGYQALCLGCRTAGPVRETSWAARSGLLGGRGDYR
jgi:hypothetical protein